MLIPSFAMQWQYFWRYLLLSISAGVATLSFAPYYHPLAYALANALFFILIYRAETFTRLMRYSFVFGFFYFLSGSAWIFISPYYYTPAPWWSAALTTALFCAAMGCSHLISAVLTRLLISKKFPALYFITQSTLLSLTEWGRASGNFAFPWLVPGYSQVPDAPLATLLPIIGIQGLSLATLLSSSVIAFCFQSIRADPTQWKKPLIGLLFLSTISGISLFTQNIEWGKNQPQSNVTVSLVQPNIAVQQKWNTESHLDLMRKYLILLSQSTGQWVIFPEGILPFEVEKVFPAFITALRDYRPETTKHIVFGSFSSSPDGLHNSLLALDAKQTQHYYKKHLVPIGEYAPPLLRAILSKIGQEFPISLQAGKQAFHSILLDQIPMAPSICYENGFSAQLRHYFPQAQGMLHITDMSWFHDSLALPQQLQMGQARAMEFSREVLQVGNNGVTAIVDANGQIRDRLPLQKTAILETTFQPRTGTTPYMRWGEFPIFIISIGLLLGCLGYQARQRRAAP